MKLTVDGREAYAYTGGKPFDPALPCIVFMHGAMHDQSVLSLESRYFAHHGHSVLALNLPGHGRSAGPALPSAEVLADWAVALLRAAGVERCTLVGHSMGSLIALETAARLGDRATRLVMVGTAFPMKVSAALLDAGLNEPQRAIDICNALSHSTLAPKPSNPGPGTWPLGANRALMRRLQSGYAAAGHGNLFHHDFSLCDRYAGALDAAQRVACPVLFILGEKDAMTPPKGAQVLAQALHAQVVRLPVGHSLMSEAPNGVIEALRRFVLPPFAVGTQLAAA
jgi:pimeloyl-ACP methyl ester carboxylesterase